MFVEVLSIEKYINSRKSKRYTVNLCGRITYDNGEKGAFVTVKNLSESGASLVCKDPIPVDEEVDVDLVLWGQEVLSFEGKIVREYKVGKNHKYGVLIEYLTDHSRKLMKEFVTEMEQKEKEIQK
jgi:hypothetical protein